MVSSGQANSHEWVVVVVVSSSSSSPSRLCTQGLLTILYGAHQNPPSAEKEKASHRPSATRPWLLALAFFR